jgi:hypothetical protein
LAFHPYPQLIPQVFNPGGFGPPRPLTAASPWPWVDHSASGLHPATLFALFRLAFATATPQQVNLATKHNSQAHSSKGTPSPEPHKEAPALTACKHTVSGTLSLPSRGTFHLSLTVLVRYRSPGSIQAYRVVPADSQQIPRARCYSGTRPMPHAALSRTGLSPTTATLSRGFPLTPHTNITNPAESVRSNPTTP